MLQGTGWDMNATCWNQQFTVVMESANLDNLMLPYHFSIRKQTNIVDSNRKVIYIAY